MLATATLGLALLGAGCTSSDGQGVAQGGDRKIGNDSTESARTSGDPGETPGTAEYELRASFGTFAEYLEAQSGIAACSKLARALRSRLGGSSCGKRVQARFAADPPAATFREVLDVQLAGRRATATVRTGNQGPYTVAFTREGGEWKVAGGAVWR